ncbi:MAG: YkgJ family cysteine cluster protein [Phycisphaerae bacterium]|nr:hypothetical protein [Tepidisphaeraceae bacterium]
MPKRLPILPTAPATKDPWFADGLAFSCTCSGNCCTGGPGFIWVDDDEIDKLAAHLGLSREETLRKHCKKVGRKWSIKDPRNARGQHDCTFLTEIELTDADKAAAKAEGRVVLKKRVCGIYPVRPLQCRTWPFWDGNLISKDDWAHAAKRCPGMNRGRTFTKAEIESLRDATEWPADGPTSG